MMLSLMMMLVVLVLVVLKGCMAAMQNPLLISFVVMLLLEKSTKCHKAITIAKLFAFLLENTNSQYIEMPFGRTVKI